MQPQNLARWAESRGSSVWTDGLPRKTSSQTDERSLLAVLTRLKRVASRLR